MQLRKLIAYGNTKLPKSTAIFNLGAAADCPSRARGLCRVSDICYADKAERQYPGCKPYRRRQQAYWLSISADQFVLEFLKAIANKKTRVTALRFNESGDFHSARCVTKAEKIAVALAKHGIKSYCYSARADLAKRGVFDRCKTLTVNGSSFMAHNEFLPVHKYSKGARCAGNCRACKLCLTKAHRVIQVQIH